MSLKARITEDMKTAMKAKDATKLSAIRRSVGGALTMSPLAS
jgi:uncharacterized protein YqeY